MEQKDNKSRLIGLASTLGANGFILLLLALNGLKYLDPPPPEMGFLMEMEYDEPKPQPEKIEVAAGKEPRAEKASPNRDIKLVQRSEGQHQGTKTNAAREATIGEDGDVEVYEPKREKEIDNRALFSAANNSEKDTLAAQVAKKVSDALTAGHPEGNTRTGNTEGEPSAKLEGRSVMGSLPLPNYKMQKAGKVVVKIWVNREGKVTRAVAGAAGTTADQSLWQAARDAALQAHFNTSATAPESQEGTITYIFKLQ
ncbi:MAG: TonB family protein [Bacteroidales bacterium]|nr:TonB family protein [Bacteroidales bacterium]